MAAIHPRYRIPAGGRGAGGKGVLRAVIRMTAHVELEASPAIPGFGAPAAPPPVVAPEATSFRGPGPG